jgi:cytochrome bd ubiquinol oxidase subunit I
MAFYGFRIMYCLAIVMFAIAVMSLYLRRTGRLFTAKWFLRTLVVMTPSGIVATLAGWYLAETGRQPWVIYGLLRTLDAVSPVPASALLSTFIAFVCIYTVFMTAFLIFVRRIIQRGPVEISAQPESSGSLKRALHPQVLDKTAVMR